MDPIVPEGPIPATDGTSTTPEDEDFDWTDVDEDRIGDTLPLHNLGWDEHPQYGSAQILDWSEGDTCVCFDVDCTTCSADDCSPSTCTYDLNDSHTLTKYHVELQSTEYPDHAVTFEVNVSAEPPITYTDIEAVLARLERIPVEYWYGLQIITEFGHGIQFLHGSYFGGGGAAASPVEPLPTPPQSAPLERHLASEAAFEELANEQLPLSDFARDEAREELATAAPSLVAATMRQLARAAPQLHRAPLLRTLRGG